MELIIWNWVPLVSIGPILFDDRLENYTDFLDFKHDSSYDLDDWKTYRVNNTASRVMIENGCIFEVTCYENFFYNGTDLIGLELDTVLNLLGSDYVKDTYYCVIYDSSNCMIFHEDGIVESISVMGCCDEE